MNTTEIKGILEMNKYVSKLEDALAVLVNPNAEEEERRNALSLARAIRRSKGLKT